MQNSNPTQHGNSDNPNQPSKDRPSGLLKNLWYALGGVVLLLILVYTICSKPGTSPVNGNQLSFNPVGGTVVIDSLGNNDKHVNPGEQVKIRIRLTNTGKDSLPAFDLVLATQDTAVKLIDNRLHFKGIGSNKTVLSDDFFEFKLSEIYFLDCIRFTSTIERPVLAGLVGTAYAAGDPPPPIDIYAYPNYRVCLGPCRLDVGPNATDQAVLTIDVGLCNDGITNLSTLDDSRVKIESVKLCVQPANVPPVTFNPMPSEDGPLDSLDYGDLGVHACGEPPNPPKSFMFSSVNGYLPGSEETTVCIYFYAKIYKSATIPIGERNLGIRAQVMRRPSGIASARLRPRR